MSYFMRHWQFVTLSVGRSLSGSTNDSKRYPCLWSWLGFSL